MKKYHQHLAIVLVLCMILSMLPARIFASSKSTVSTNLAEQSFTVNAATEFTVTTHGNDDAGKTVWGSFTVQQNGQDINLQDVAKLEYQESSSGAWYEFYGDFGPASGFPMGEGDVTSHFKVTFRQAGSYDVRIAMVTANEAREVLCELQETITVAEAHNASTVSTNLAEQSFTVNAATEFTVTTHGNDDAGKTVWGSFTVQQNGQDINLQDVAKLEYQESSSGTWYEFYGDFGPASGFPMGEGDVTSHFKVTFRQAGSYDVRIAMVTANEAREVLCEVQKTITVAEAHNASTVSTNLAEQSFTVNAATEFTVTTHGNDDAGKTVWGSFTVQQNGQAINLQDVATLQYRNSADGNWYEFYGDFGPASGFPMGEGDVTSHFKVTFRQAGSYDVRIAMVTADEAREEVCAVDATIMVQKEKVTVSVTKEGNGKIEINGQEVTGASLPVNKNEEVTVTITPESGSYIKTLTVAGESKSVDHGESYTETLTFDANAMIAVKFVAEYTVTVDAYDSNAGSVTLNGQSASSITVDEGEEASICVTANEGYQISAIKIGGEEQTINASEKESKTITYKVEKNCTVTVAFVRVFKVTVSYDDTIGSVSVAGATVANEGSVTVKETDGKTITVVATPNSNYHVSAFEINEKAEVFTPENGKGYTVSLPAVKDYKIEVTFALDTYTITFPQNGYDGEFTDKDGNSLTAYTLIVEHGATVQFKFVPKAGYAATVSDGENKLTAQDGVYKIENVAAAHTISVVTKDVEAPSVTPFVSDANAWKQEKRITFTTADNSGDAVTVYVSDTEYSDLAALREAGLEAVNEYTAKANGIYYIYAVDSSNNFTKTSVKVEMIDTTAPKISQPQQVETGRSYYQSVTYTFTVKDTQSGVKQVSYGKDQDGNDAGVLTPGEEGYQFTVTENGTYYVFAEDNVGNRNSLSVIVENVDTTLPTISNIAASEEWDNASNTVSFVATDNVGVKGAYWSDAEYSEKSEIIKNAIKLDGADGKYEFSVQENGTYYIYALDEAGNIAKGNANVAYIDKVIPTGTISMDANTWSELINVLTFGIWKNTKVEVTAVGEDKGGSGVKEVLYYKSDAEVVLSRDDLNDLYSNGEFIDKAITVEADERFTVYACIVDGAGNYDFISTDGIIYDNTESVITIQPEKPNEYGYYNSDVKVGILVNENVNDGTAYSGIQKISYTITTDGKETYRQDLYSFSKNAETGEITIKDWASGEEKVTELTGDVPLYDQLKSTWSGSITVDAKANNSDDVKVIVYVTDNAGNSVNNEKKPCELKINSTPPTATLTSDDTAAITDEDGRGYFTAERTLKLTITDRAATFNKQNAIDGFSVTATDADKNPIKDENGNVIEQPYTLGAWSSNGDEHSVTVTFPYDGYYEWSYQYTNKADLSFVTDEINTDACVSPFDFTVDTKAPTGTISVDEENGWSQLIEVLTFGVWKNTKVEVTAVGDDEGGSGWDQKPLYYKGNAETALSWVELEALYSDGKFSANPVTVEKDEKFVVYARIADKVGNYDFISTDGIIYDNTESVITIQPEKPNGYDYYNSDVTVGILVNENVKDGSAYSGIQKISYTITTDGKETYRQDLYSFSKNAETGEITIKDWASGEEKVTELTGDVPLYDQLKSTWSGSITVDAKANNSDDVKVIVYVTDNAGNSVNNEENPCELKINSTPPTATLTSNDTAANTDEDGHGYFAAERTLELTITDRNTTFNEDNAIDGFDVTATDAKGEKIKDENGKVIEQPYTLGQWRHDGDVHRVTVTFPYDANYKWSYKYTNKADLSFATDEINTENCASPFDFTVDTKKPTGTISANENTWSQLIEVLTFGIWKNTKVEVTADGDDEGGSGWDQKPLYYKGNAEAALSWVELEALYSDGKFSANPVTVEKDEKFVVYARIADNAGNYTFISTDGLIYDNTESVITIQPEKPNDALYYNSDVTVGILVNENVNNVSAYSGIKEISYTITTDGKETYRQDLYSFSKNAETGEITIKDWASGEEKVTELTGDVPLYDQLKSTWSGSITVDAKANNSDNVKVIVYVTDNAGNSVNNEENPCILKINSTPPTATLTSDDKAANTNEDGHGYFAAGRTLELTITDRATTFNEQNAIKGFSVTATDAKGEKIKDENGKVIEQPYALSEWRHNGAEHSVTVTFPYDGNYKWSYKYTNKADLSVATSELNTEACASPFGFTVDTTAPFGTVAVKSAEGREAQWDELAQGALHFGFWSREKITLRGTFNDLTSPIVKVEYYKVSATNASDGTVALKPRELDAVTNWQRFEGFDVLANEQFVVYIKVTDQAGNYCYLSTDGLIVDDDAPVAETIAPEITLQPQQPVNGIYNGNVKVDITVKDPLTGGTYSGLKKVSYKVFNMGELTQEETLFVFDSQNPQQGDLKQNIVRTITVDSELNNSNDVVVRVYAEDNAANSSEQKITLKIDTTAPTINVSYDNNNADSQTYFKANRTATIVVTERNFNPKDVNVKITGTGGSTPALSEWRESKGSGNLDNTRWTATVTYSVDGDYSFDIAYTDLANNPCPGAQYGNSVAPKTFTIDKTIPVIRVTYDNNEAQNTNYYKAARTATIMINEHNFSTDRIQITLSASDDGVAVKTPAVSGWTNNGDTHTATIAFADDAFYGFDIAYTDLAGNAAADFERQNFYVDQTAPALTITGVKDKSANKGDVIPKITYSDTNFDANAVEITLVGANRKDVSLEGEYQDIHNGAEFTFKNFEEKKEIDDIYTLRAKLTDKAGNTSEEVITFSVNRFGSTYALSEAAEKLNGTYVQTPIDVVITETNTDEIKNIKLTLFKNNETIVLNEGEDYAIELTGGDGQWYHYTYTIFANNFENDGVYRLTLHSEDAAGNVAENTLDTKESAISFGVDSTNPTITVTNLESDETYALESIRVSMSANDNLMLASVAVYLDDYDKVYKSWSAEEVAEILSTGNSFEFDVDGNSTKAHKVKIVCTDAAGNETIEEITDFYVTTNLFVRFYTNTPLFIGSIVGVVALIGVIIFLIAKKKKTNKAVNAK